MKKVIYALLVLALFSLPAFAQEDLEFSGGYRHISGDQGLDGYFLGVGWNPIPHFQLHLTYDGVYDNSTIGNFSFTSVGTIVINSHLQELLTGPRYFLPGLFKGGQKVKGKIMIPYVEAGFGEARLHSDVRQANLGSVQSADTAFAWQIGGGADFRIYPHFAVRTDLGFLRTHFANGGQSRIRLGLGVVYSFRARATQ